MSFQTEMHCTGLEGDAAVMELDAVVRRCAGNCPSTGLGIH
jgi:hypothetical protein